MSLVLADFDGGMPAGIRGRFIPCHTRPSCAELDSSAGNANTQEQNFLKWIQQTWAQFSALTASGLGWPGPKRDTSQSLTSFSSGLHTSTLCDAAFFL